MVGLPCQQGQHSQAINCTWLHGLPSQRGQQSQAATAHGCMGCPASGANTHRLPLLMAAWSALPAGPTVTGHRTPCQDVTCRAPVPTLSPSPVTCAAKAAYKCPPSTHTFIPLDNIDASEPCGWQPYWPYVRCITASIQLAYSCCDAAFAARPKWVPRLINECSFKGGLSCDEVHSLCPGRTRHW
jgi:hypothetical protein